MAKILNQVVVQENQPSVEKRNVLQYTDGDTNLEGTLIWNYEEMSESEKAVYDEFIALCITKINT
jgi:hypothetical protein